MNFSGYFSNNSLILVPLADTFHIRIDVIRDVEFFLGPDSFGSPVEVAQENRNSGSFGYKVETSFPALYRTTRAFRGYGQLKVFILFEFLYHLAYQLGSATCCTVDRYAAEVAQDGTERPFEESFLDHDLGIASDRAVVQPGDDEVPDRGVGGSQYDALGSWVWPRPYLSNP